MKLLDAFEKAYRVAMGGEGGYSLDGRAYPDYMTNGEWEAFCKGLSPSVYENFSKTLKDEVVAGKRPPSMARYASSMRLLYELTADKSGFVYGKKLTTCFGDAAVSDGFYEADGRTVFVLSKCREIYAPLNTAIGKRYETLYRYIEEATFGLVRVETELSKCGRYLRARYFAEDEELLHFDLKEVITLLLAIATDFLKGKLSSREVDLFYLLYDPEALLLDNASRERVDEIYARTMYEYSLVDFSSLFGAILAFVREELCEVSVTDEEIEAFLVAFTTALASQEFFKELLP